MSHKRESVAQMLAPFGQERNVSSDGSTGFVTVGLGSVYVQDAESGDLVVFNGRLERPEMSAALLAMKAAGAGELPTDEPSDVHATFILPDAAGFGRVTGRAAAGTLFLSQGRGEGRRTLEIRLDDAERVGLALLRLAERAKARG